MNLNPYACRLLQYLYSYDNIEVYSGKFYLLAVPLFYEKRLFSISDFADGQIRFWGYYTDIYYYALCILLPSPACIVPALA